MLSLGRAKSVCRKVAWMHARPEFISFLFSMPCFYDYEALQKLLSAILYPFHFWSIVNCWIHIFNSIPADCFEFTVELSFLRLLFHCFSLFVIFFSPRVSGTFNSSNLRAQWLHGATQSNSQFKEMLRMALLKFLLQGKLFPFSGISFGVNSEATERALKWKCENTKNFSSYSIPFAEILFEHAVWELYCQIKHYSS